VTPMKKSFARAALCVALSGCGAASAPLEAESSLDTDAAAPPTGPQTNPSDAGLPAQTPVDAGPAPDAALPTQADAGDAAAACGNISDEAQVGRGPVDIVIVLDTSGSMAPHICNVSANLSRFAEGVGANTRVVSIYDMGVLGTFTSLICGGDDPLATTTLARDPQRYLHTVAEVDSFNALQVLVGQYPAYRDFLRADAPTHFIVVSDDESTRMNAADFSTQMRAALGHPFYFHAIVSDGDISQCYAAAVGEQYLTLADQTGGQKLPICAEDWTQLFAKLEAAVVATATLPCTFDIPAPPADKQLDTKAVRVSYTPHEGAKVDLPRADSMSQCGDHAAWAYDDPANPKQIVLCPASCEAVKTGGKIGIAFGCAPDVLR
jgi:hypothetical protein